MQAVAEGTGLKAVAAAHNRRQAIVELAVGYGLILLVLWTPRAWQRVLYAAPVLWIGFITWRNFSGWASMGMRRKNLFGGSWVVALAVLLATLSGVVAMRMGTLHLPGTLGLFLKTYLGYAVWSFVQQMLLVDFFLGRLIQLLRSKVLAVLGSAGVFALAHLPNPVLTPLTLVFGVVTCLVFLHYRNLLVLGMTHAILGICVACTLPGYVTHNMRVGLGYVDYAPPAEVHRDRTTQMLSTSGWSRGGTSLWRF